MAKRRRAQRPPTTVPRARSRRAVSDERRRPSARVLLAGLAVVGAVAFLAVVFIGSATARDYSCAELLQRPADQGADGFAAETLGQQHVAPGSDIKYGFCPPTSGSHYNARGVGPIAPRFYGPDSDTGPGGWVHNLEHGYVVALYRCGDQGCPSETDLEALRQFVADGPPTQSAAACGYRSKVLAARFDDMATPFAVLAWDRVLLLDTFEPAAARQFATNWIERNGPEPNAC